MRGLLFSVVAATALLLCRGMDTPTSPSTTSSTTDIHSVVHSSTSSRPSTTDVDTTTTSTTTIATTQTTTSTSGQTSDAINATTATSPTASAQEASLSAANGDVSSAIGDASTGEQPSPTKDYSSTDESKDSKCSYNFVNKNKYNPQTGKYDNVSAAMEFAIKKSPMAEYVFNKYLDPKADTAPAFHDIALPKSSLKEPHPSEPESLHPSLPLHDVGTHRAVHPKLKKSLGKLAKIEDPPKDFDVNKMFAKISNNANGFTGGIRKFNNVIHPNRPIGFNSNFIKERDNTGFLNGFDSIFRRKRMAVPPPPSVYSKQKPKSVCEPDRHMVTAFFKNNKLCYLYKPEIQAVEMDKCRQTECNVCSDHGSAQCVSQDLSAWVWAYCPHQGHVITPEYLEYPAYCSCMVIKC